MKTVNPSPSKASGRLLATIASCIRAGEVEEDLRRDLCEDVSWFLQTVVADEPEFRWIWFDGVIARHINVSSEGVEIEGLLYFVIGQEQTLAPLRVRLAPRTESGELRFRASFVEEGVEPVPYGECSRVPR